MTNCSRGLAIGGHDGSFLIFVVGVRSHTGEVLSVYLTDADIENLTEFLTLKHEPGRTASDIG